MFDYVIGWTCPSCGAKNRNSFFNTGYPMCLDCNIGYIWDDLLTAREIKLARRYLRNTIRASD